MGQYEGDLGHILEMFIIKVFCWRHSTTPLAIIKKFGFYIVMSSLNINQNTSFIKKSFLSFLAGNSRKDGETWDNYCGETWDKNLRGLLI